ncbi:MAG: hypothetical protein AB7O24_24805 [Kofleriaceae bacterium]
MRNLMASTVLAWSLGCGAAASNQEAGVIEQTNRCDEINSCGGDGSELVLGLAVAAILGASALIERLVR